MKRFLSLLIACSLFFSSSIAAHAAKRAYIGLYKGYTETLDAFLKAVKNDTAEKAYSVTGPLFQKTTSLSDFAKLLETAQLKDTVGKKWFEKKNDAKAVLISGEFLYRSGKKIDIFFRLNAYGKIWKVDGMTAQLDSDFVLATFPKGDGLKAFIVHEVENFRAGIQDKKATQAFFSKMSSLARNTIPKTDLEKAFSDFKAQDRDTTLPGVEALHIAEGFPSLQGQQIAVTGDYQNEKFLVTFRFLYDFEDYTWKLNSLTMNPRSLEDIAKEKAEKEAAKKALEERRAARRKK